MTFPMERQLRFEDIQEGVDDLTTAVRSRTRAIASLLVGVRGMRDFLASSGNLFYVPSTRGKLLKLSAQLTDSAVELCKAEWSARKEGDGNGKTKAVAPVQRRFK